MGQFAPARVGQFGPAQVGQFESSWVGQLKSARVGQFDRSLHPDHLYDYFEFTNTPYFSTPPARRITIDVAAGGRLVLNGSTLQGLNACGDRMMWEGMNINGDDQSDQIPLSAGLGAYQGELEITNSSTVKDARIGIDAYGEREYMHDSWNHPEYNTTMYSTRVFEHGQGGAIVHADNSTFQDCRRDFYLLWYPGTGFTPSIKTPSIFNTCLFTSTSAGMADICFYRDGDGGVVPGIFHANVFGIEKTHFIDNTFYCDPVFPQRLRSSGIYGVDAGLRVYPSCNGGTYSGAGCSGTSGTGNSFQNMVFGIWNVNTPTNASASRIMGNTFDNNGTGIAIEGMDNTLTVADNTFTVPNYASPYPGIGISLTGCKAYTVTNNSFNIPSQGRSVPKGNIGIIVANNHSEYVQVDNNHFDYLENGSVSLWENGGGPSNPNDGLEWHCNDYYSHIDQAIYRSSTDAAGTTIIPGTLRPNQGSGAGAYTPAGNLFFNPCSSSSGPTNLDADATAEAAQQVNYYFTDAPSVTPAFKPNCYNSTAYTISAHNYPAGDKNNTCATVLFSHNPTARMASGNAQAPDNNNMSDEERQYLATQESLSVSREALNYALNDQPEKAAMLLASYHRYGSALSFYVAANKVADARRMLRMMPRDTKEEQQQARLAEMRLDLIDAKKGWASAGEADKNYLLSIASNSSVSGCLANGVTEALGLKLFMHPLPMIKRSARIGNENKGILSNHALFSVAPNPTSGHLTIQSSKGGSITFHSVVGTLVGVYQLHEGSNALSLPQSLAEGIYTGYFRDTDGHNTDMIRIVYKP